MGPSEDPGPSVSGELLPVLIIGPFANEVKYLQTAVIKETLRLSSPVAGCLPRIVPPGGATVESFYLPAGVSIPTYTSIHPLPF